MIHYKKLALTSALFLGVSTGALANGMPELPKAENPSCDHLFKPGTYAGLGLGWHGARATHRGVLTDPSFSGATLTSYSTKETDNGIAGEVFIGHRWSNCAGFVYGLELGALLSTAKTVDRQFISFANFDFTNKRDFTINASMVMGKVLAKRWMPYFKLRVALTKFSSGTRLFANTSFPSVAAVTLNDNKYRLGFVPSVGLEYAVSSALHIRAEGSYEFYKSYDNNQVLQAISATSITTRVKPSSFRVMAGVSYTFKR